MSYHYYLIDWDAMERFDLGNYASLPSEFSPHEPYDFDDHLDAAYDAAFEFYATKLR